MYCVVKKALVSIIIAKSATIWYTWVYDVWFCMGFWDRNDLNKQDISRIQGCKSQFTRIPKIQNRCFSVFYKF